jgi:diguanylate cyclase (GGDEF)-like protein/hemerythrin-like metal-binding protein
VKSLVKVVAFQNSLVEISNKFEALSMTDCLTGIANRRCFDEVMNQEYSRHARSGGKLSLVMLDIDHFKLFNDHYGHVSGDECLRQIARVLDESTVRPGDLVARYGGEEFVCILPETDQPGALLIAERMRQGILDLAIHHAWSDAAEYVSASLGCMTSCCGPDNTAVGIVAQADALLYRSKSLGRNRVEYNMMPQKPEQEWTNLVQLVWKDGFCSRNYLIDTQHQSLFRSTNDLLEAILMARSKDEIYGIITQLIDDATQHFHDEETILGSVGFPGLNHHTIEHARLLTKGRELAREFSSDTLSSGSIFQFLVQEMVMQHMLKADREFFPFTSSMAAAELYTGVE